MSRWLIPQETRLKAVMNTLNNVRNSMKHISWAEEIKERDFSLPPHYRFLPQVYYLSPRFLSSARQGRKVRIGLGFLAITPLISTIVLKPRSPPRTCRTCR